MHRRYRCVCRGLVSAAIAALLVGLYTPLAGADWRGHGVAGWGRSWGGHHHRHGLHARARGNDFAIALSFALPLFYGRRHEQASVYASRPGRVVVHERAPATVVYRQSSTVGAYASANGSRALPPGCREFNTQVTIAGRLQAAWGIACPQADGSWRVVD